MNTPVTPILIEADTAARLEEAGYEVRFTEVDPDTLGDLVDDYAFDAWEPERPQGDGWMLHYKGWLGDDGDCGAIWARKPPQPPMEMHTARLNWVTPMLELEIVREARVSAPANERNTATAAKLVASLIRRGHWSTLQMGNMCVEILTTRDIARQMLRHTSLDGVRELPLFDAVAEMSGIQEFSQRYADPAALGDGVTREARLQHSTNRQASVPCRSAQIKMAWENRQDLVWIEATAAYKEAIKMGIAKEVARVVLPEGMTPTRLHFNGTLRTWLHMLEVRRGHGTQPEAIQLAESIWRIFKEQAPTVAAAAELLAAQKAELQTGYDEMLKALRIIASNSTDPNIRVIAEHASTRPLPF